LAVRSGEAGGSMQTVSQLLKVKGNQIFSVAPHDSVLRAIEIMATRYVGALLVMSEGTLLGIISERDVVRAFAKDGARLADMHVRDLMTVEVKTCGLETPMVEAEKLMNKLRVRHLPVMDGGKLVGMLSIRDVMVWRQREARDEVNVLRDAMIAVRNR